ncbi:hypothetical protein [uncultured Fibrobacter sp.]|uniref:hypothetical protein n=1 Tax=uncultured Fibrobacter sp. TaxID=261512 RepID=UPI0025DAB868|nr:hypothetical protein [uncultured Fibrobacter sp.]
MTLLITVFAAVIATIFWYRAGAKDEMKISTLCYLYWGASLMWFIDAVFEYAELRAEYFTPAAADMLNDTFLGFSAVALGLVIWLAVVLWKDPKGKWRNIATNH